MQIWPLLAQLRVYDVTRIVNFPNFGKLIEDQIFHLKKYICYDSKFRTFYCCLVLIYCFEEFGKVTSKTGPRFNTLLKIFYKKKKKITIKL